MTDWTPEREEKLRMKNWTVRIMDNLYGVKDSDSAEIHDLLTELATQREQIAELERDLAQRQKEFRALSDVNDDLQKHIRTLREAVTALMNSAGTIPHVPSLNLSKTPCICLGCVWGRAALEATKEIG